MLVAPVLAQTSPKTVTYQYGVDYQLMRYGGDGVHTDVSGTVFIPLNSGCTASDYDGMPANAIAVVLSGSDPCAIVDKALVAESVGAIAVIQRNAASSTTLSNVRVRIVDWHSDEEGTDPLVKIPVFSVSYSVGMSLVNESPLPTLSFTADLKLEVNTTFNVICETGSSETSSNVIMVGSHLDSVPEGPGMNDNGSGSMTVLEMAKQFLRLNFASKAVNPVRFAWWGAEEIGLLGARHYVREAQKSGTIGNVAMYFNYDMLGSPNFIPQVHDARAVLSNIPEEVQHRSEKLQHALEEWFSTNSLPNSYSAMTGGSDYLPFLEAGVAAGGLATGASAKKTDDDRDTFGGLAEAAYDPCYHLYCDTPANVSPEALRQCSRAAAYALETLMIKEDIRGFLDA